MKAAGTCATLLALYGTTEAARLSDAGKGAGVNKVVKMLQDMLKQSEDDWKAEKEAYGKFKCYCDDNKDKKTTAIQEATKSIGLLTNKIDEIRGTNGALSVETAQLKSDMEENDKARADAKALREKEKKSFTEEEKDLTAAVSQMEEAIKLLSTIGADQTGAANADHEKFMAKYKDKSLVSIRSSVKKALTAASAFIEPEKKAQLQAFLQAPFTGTYSAQSGQIVGILKDMKDTFKSNLATAREEEKRSKATYTKFKENKESEHADLKKSYDEKQGNLGTNDGDLSSKKSQLQQATKQKSEDEDFMAKLNVQCTDKRKEYETRRDFADNERVALSKTIAILDNDVSSEKFGAVDATKSALLQLSSIPARSSRAEALALLQHAPPSANLQKVIALLQSGNPFSVILQQIDKMVKLANDEQKVDNEQKKWCESTNDKNKKSLGDTKDELTGIAADIAKLQADINDPVSGIKKQMSEAEDSLKTNIKNQGVETKSRRDDNIKYQKDMSMMQDAVHILTKAEDVLTDYYTSLDNEQVGLLQADPKPPESKYEGKYKGQNEQAKEVLKMLAFLKTETSKEETVAHDAELKAQHDYEDSMKSLLDSEQSLQESIGKLNEDLAGKEKDLLAKHEDKENTEQEKIALDRYMASIKPGCDFIQKNFDDRKKSRDGEKKALQDAKVKLEGTPAFKAAQQKAKEESFGKCKISCMKDEAGAKCKACLAGISVPGYCAGHKGAPGC